MNYDKKRIEKEIVTEARKMGHRAQTGYIYWKYGEYFIIIDTIVIPKNGVMHLTIFIKKYIYDDLFWDIFKTDECKSKQSLRAIGAFSAPSIIAVDEEIPLSCVDSIGVVTVLNNAEKKILDFLKDFDIDRYIADHKDIPYHYVLSTLSYIDNNRIDKAIELSKERIAEGDRGGFIVGDVINGKGYFDYLLKKFNE